MENFSLELNDFDRKILEAVAKQKGYANGRDMINDLVEKFPETINKKKIMCKGKSRKFKNIYPIPTKHVEFYNALKCQHSSTLSGIVFKFVIFPEMIDAITSELRSSSGD